MTTINDVLEHLKNRPETLISREIKHPDGRILRPERHWCNPEKSAEWFEEHEKLCKNLEKELREILEDYKNHGELRYSTTEMVKEILGENQK